MYRIILILLVAKSQATIQFEQIQNANWIWNLLQIDSDYINISNITCEQCLCRMIEMINLTRSISCQQNQGTCQLLFYNATARMKIDTNSVIYFQKVPKFLQTTINQQIPTTTWPASSTAYATKDQSSIVPTTLSTTQTTTIVTTTSTSTICSTTAITTTVTSNILPPQCSNYTLNTDGTRNAAYTILGNACDDQIFTPSPVWVRFSGAAGTLLANCPVVNSHCNTNSAGWYSGVYPSTAGDTNNGTVCYTWPGLTCLYNNSISVTNCNGYYVFALASSPRCSLRYCTI